MKKRLEKEMSSIRDNSIVLTIFPNENYHEMNMHLLKIITKSKPIGAYITLNRPYHKIIELMQDKKIDHKKILFLDCVTKKGGEVDNCVYLNSFQSLIPLGVALEKIYLSPDHSFIFLDSLDALSIYHSDNILIKFIRNFVEKIRENEKVGFIIGLKEGTDKKIVDEITIICDKIIDLSNLKK